MIQLKRARRGTAVLTLQVELEEDDEAELIGELLAGDEAISDILSNHLVDFDVAFLDRPARGSKVHDIVLGQENDGPADFGFVEAEEAPAWYDDRGGEARPDRFAPVVK